MAYPIMAPGHTWYKTETLRSVITEINIVDTYTATGSETETWNADVDDSGAIKCYLNGTVLTISGNGSGKIALNEDSSYLFSYPIENTNTGEILFINCAAINGLTLFDSSSVKDLSRAFAYCLALTELDVTGWDTSNVETLRYTFASHNSIGLMSLASIQGINNWNTGNVTSMRTVFQNCVNLTELDVSNWDLSSCTDTSYMFYNCSALTTIPVSNWNTGNVTTMASMFGKCTALETLDVSNWNTGNVTTMASMFSMNNYGENPPPITTLDVSKWNVSNVTDMGWTFYGLGNLTTLDVSKWNVSNVMIFHHTFAHCSKLVLNDAITDWDVSSAKTFNAMFHANKNTNLDLSKWNVSNCECFAQMFEYNVRLTEIKGLENWDTSSGKSFYEMFYGCQALKELDLSSFDTRNAYEGWIDPQRNAAGGGVKNMFGMLIYNADGSVNNYARMMQLEKVTIGPTFSFNGDGTCTAAVLPAPDSTYIFGADGNWYNSNGEQFTPAEVPSLVANTYYTSISRVKDLDLLVKNETLLNIANALRKNIGTTRTYSPSEFAGAIENSLKTGYDMFWDEFQQNGTRTVYTGMFCGGGWTVDTFKPKYDIKPTNAGEGFLSTGFLVDIDLAEVLNSIGIKLDTSNCTSFHNMARYGGPSRYPEFDLRKATNVVRMFWCCSYLRTLDKLIFPEDGSLDTELMFEGSGGLVNITVEGTIGMTIKLQWSKSLSVDTMKSIITHLKDHSGTDKAGTYSVKLHPDCWDRLEADSAAPDGGTWKDYVDKLGWMI